MRLSCQGTVEVKLLKCCWNKLNASTKSQLCSPPLCSPLLLMLMLLLIPILMIMLVLVLT